MGKIVVGRLGDVEFSFQEGSMTAMERQTNWYIDRAEPIDGFGVAHARRKNYDQLRISGVVFPGTYGTAQSVQRLRDLGDTGEPQLLVDGEGTVYGYWLVSQVSESKSHLNATGVAQKSEYQLILESAGDDPDEVST